MLNGQLTSINIRPDRIRKDGRKKLLVVIASICVLIITPFTIKNILVGYYLIAFASSLSSFALCIQMYWYVRYDRPAMHDALPYMALIIMLLLLIHTVGVYGAVWSYAILMAIVFALSLRQAMVLGTFMIIATVLLTSKHMPEDWLIRYGISLLAIFILSVFFVSQIDKMQTLLKRNAISDPMTGALNRRTMNQHLSQAFFKNEQDRTPAVLAILDLDNFKQVNDKFGHDKGDETIVNLVKLLNVHLREEDRIFRLGGDEILILLNDTQADKAEKLLTLICQKVDKSKDISTSTSIGAYTVFNSKNTEDWLKQADKALYAAKQQGRNQLVFSDYKGGELSKSLA